MQPSPFPLPRTRDPNPDPAFWAGRRVLVTGHTGFKGGWLCLWLERLGARVSGLALAPETTPSLFATAGIGRGLDSHLADIRDPAAVQACLAATDPEIVIHMAAQALVRAAYRDPLATYRLAAQLRRKPPPPLHRARPAPKRPT